MKTVRSDVRSRMARDDHDSAGEINAIASVSEISATPTVDSGSGTTGHSEERAVELQPSKACSENAENSSGRQL